MFHTLAYTLALGAGTDVDIPALSDDIIQIQNNHFILPGNMAMIGAFGASATLRRVKLTSPSIRQILPTYLRPVNLGTLPVNNPNFPDFSLSPFTVTGQEELQMLATSGIAMGTEQFTGLLWLQDRPDPAPIGDYYYARATSTTAALASTWTTVQLTWETTPPIGTYAVVGAEYQATNGVAARFIFDNQSWRPGCLGTALITNRTAPAFYNGRLGRWGNFRTISLPRAQVLNITTDAAHEFYLQLVRTGP